MAVIKVEIPSLNERTNDIIPIAKHFLNEFNRKFGKKFGSFSTQTEDALMNYRWTGNVLELKNRIEKVVLISQGTEITVQDLGIINKSDTNQFEENKKETEFPPIP